MFNDLTEQLVLIFKVECLKTLLSHMKSNNNILIITRTKKKKEKQRNFRAYLDYIS